LDFDQQRRRVLDVALTDQHDVVDVSADQRLGQRAGRLYRDTLGERVAAHGQLGATDLVVHRRVELGLNADDLDPGFDGLRRDGHSRDEAAAADWYDERGEVRRGSQHLQREGTLPGD